jgi:16S rRNA (cytidine1402-2'-O)-methyltransferase
MPSNRPQDPAVHSATPSRPAPDPPGRSYRLHDQRVAAPAADPGLYIVATPIGNLRDITLRALDVLAAVDLIACEDTRVTRKLLDRYNIRTPLTSYHDHNAAEVRPKLIRRLGTGMAVALVSDAGTPLVSDPGFKLVRAAHEEGIRVVSVPGPSAALVAITICGLPADRFFFEGFLPTRSGQRNASIQALKNIPASIVLFETGPRIAETLADLAIHLGAREAAVCRELTKLHEEFRRGELGELASFYAGDAERRGEFVLVVAPPASGAGHISRTDLDALLRDAMHRLSVKEAVGEIAAVTGLRRREVYQRALSLARKSKDEAGR